MCLTYIYIVKLLIQIIFLIGIQFGLLGQEIKKCTDATIHFVSEAPLELISATSTECAGVLDVGKGEFAFRVRLRSFEGFNSALQKEHFNENYLESDKFPSATFKGHFIDRTKELSNGEHQVKGNLTVHGVEEERVFNVTIETTDSGGISFECDFIVQLETHHIDVPRIVYQKIAEEIQVSINGVLN